ncbi:MAG: hypothetical protein KGZ67_12995 [Hydrogenophaga sp.]|nr:hypothetical protein [Hydrogenophaga sp.]
MAITISRRGMPARRIVGVFAHTVDAVLRGLDLLDGAPGAISVEVLA